MRKNEIFLWNFVTFQKILEHFVRLKNENLKKNERKLEILKHFQPTKIEKSKKKEKSKPFCCSHFQPTKRRKVKCNLKCVHFLALRPLKRRKFSKEKKEPKKRKDILIYARVLSWYYNQDIYIYGLRPYYILFYFFLFFWNRPNEKCWLGLK